MLLYWECFSSYILLPCPKSRKKNVSKYFDAYTQQIIIFFKYINKRMFVIEYTTNFVFMLLFRLF